MRRPLDWTLVSLAAMLLSFGRLLAEDPPAATAVHRAAAIEAAPAAPPYADIGLTSSAESPFAYIREDGSQVFLPAAPPVEGPLQIEDALPLPTARG